MKIIVFWIVLSFINNTLSQAPYHPRASPTKSKGNSLFCDKIEYQEGVIQYSAKFSPYSYSQSSPDLPKCWFIAVPEAKYIRFVLQEYEYSSYKVLLSKVTVAGEDKEYSLHINDVNKHFTELNDVRIDLDDESSSSSSYRRSSEWSQIFRISYTIEDLICVRNNSFRCSKFSCINKSKVCDGLYDCEGGKDEEGCDFGIKSMEGVNASRLGAISWLKSERTISGIWRKNGQRAITALYLANGVDKKKSCDEDEMFSKEIQLKTSVFLLRNGTDSVTPNELGMLIHGLLVTCQNPRSFFGFNLVRVLKQNVEGSLGGTHPITHLALCNANETVSDIQVKKLQQIVQNVSAQSFFLDVQAIALMALSCIRNSGNQSQVQESINSTLKRFRELQRPDGSFGNVYTTALVTQALLGSSEEETPHRRIRDAVKYLLKQKTGDQSFGDFLATYLILPILNGKSLVDISRLGCPPKKPRNDSLSEIENRLGPKMYTEYSLYIGDELDVVHSISLRVAQNLTAFEIMELAAVADPKYKFESHREGKNLYVYSIAGITNDPEAGKFWLLYLEQNHNNETAELVAESPDQKIIQEHDRMIMWYKTVDV